MPETPTSDDPVRLLLAPALEAEIVHQQGGAPVADEGGRFSAPPPSMNSPIHPLSATGGRVGAHLTLDRAGVAPESVGERAHAVSLHPEQGDLLPLSKQQATAARLGEGDRCHAASMAKPPRPTGFETQTCAAASSVESPPAIIHQNARCNRTRGPRTPRRTHRRPQRPIRRPLPTRPNRTLRPRLPRTHPHTPRQSGVASTPGIRQAFVDPSDGGL